MGGDRGREEERVGDGGGGREREEGGEWRVHGMGSKFTQHCARVSSRFIWLRAVNFMLGENCLCNKIADSN